MSNSDTKALHPHVPFLYEMAVSFFDMAKENLEQVLQVIDGYRELEIDPEGRPKAPNHVIDEIRNLPPGDMIAYVGSCLSATTNLGLAYVQAFRLLGLLTRGKDAFFAKIASPNLVELFDSLPDITQQVLHEIHSKVKEHDLEMEIASGNFPEEHENSKLKKGKGFRATLAYWQSQKLLQDSHRSLFGTDGQSILRLFIPFGSILVLDKIIAEQIAPQLGATYETIDQRMARHNEGPVLKWDQGMIHVALPKRLGRTLEARWRPDITSVIRIRESGTKIWSPGFETPFNQCSFVDLRPETEYEIKLTHKNQDGESDPVITSTKTVAE